ncbi:MAG: hypothetical protein WBP12_03210 [Candidatus Saccharimonas sp.]
MHLQLWLYIGIVITATIVACLAVVWLCRRKRTATQQLQLRFRRYCHKELASKREITSSKYSPFFERMKHTPSVRLSNKDFMTVNGKGVPIQPLFIQWSVHRYGKRPFRRYYLVAMRVQGDIEDQELTYTMYEHRFVGLFALHRDPEWRHREFTMPVAMLATLPGEMMNYWRRHIDRGWHSPAKRENTTQVLETFAQHLRF